LGRPAIFRCLPWFQIALLGNIALDEIACVNESLLPIGGLKRSWGFCNSYFW